MLRTGQAIPGGIEMGARGSAVSAPERGYDGGGRAATGEPYGSWLAALRREGGPGFSVRRVASPLRARTPGLGQRAKGYCPFPPCILRGVPSLTAGARRGIG